MHRRGSCRGTPPTEVAGGIHQAGRLRFARPCRPIPSLRKVCLGGRTMKRLLLGLSVIASCAFLSGCTVTTTVRRPYVYDPPPPSLYVYTYPDGCWADDVWYSPCPWAPGPSYGYYVYRGGGYAWYPSYRWTYRPGLPPPRWHHRPAHPRPHHPPPPAHRPRHPRRH